MATFFLIIIYITFISLGLPDSLLGASWAVMRADLNADFAVAGIISMVISGGTILSSLLSERILKKFRTGPVVVVSVTMTAAALLGFSISPSVIWLLICAVPLGLGAGSIDTGLNNYVAVNYKPHHMSWLHCFWGIGALGSPLIMAQFIQNGGNWRGGYVFVGVIQFCLAAMLLATLPQWLKREPKSPAPEELPPAGAPTAASSVLSIPGVPLALVTFFFYCGIEAITGLWGASYLIESQGLPPATAARWVSFFFIGITAGRFLTGFLTMKLTSKQLIRYGEIIMLASGAMLILPLPRIFSLVGIGLLGFGCGPVFPCMLHETPHRFGLDKSQKIIGIQMASAYTGSTFLPPVFGYIASNFFSVKMYPPVIFAFAVITLLACERLNRIVGRQESQTA